VFTFYNLDLTCLLDNPVGVDYLSVASYEHMIPAHVVFLKSKEIVIVEALKLDDVEPGMYMLHCLPLRLAGAEGSPVRCILIK
jgi:kynurenine formamidase